MVKKIGQRVYVINNRGDDYSAAEKFGEIKVVIYGKLRISEREWIKTLHQGLEDIREDDYVLISGSIIANALAIAVVLKKHGIVHTLNYSKWEKEYYEVTLTEEDMTCPK